jgi:hypothetical protein
MSEMKMMIIALTTALTLTSGRITTKDAVMLGAASGATGDESAGCHIKSLIALGM